MTLELLKKRIKTTEDLREIVSTMKALSSVSILQYEQANRSLEKYRRNLHDGFQALVHKYGIPQIAVYDKTLPRYLVVLVGTDSGMVGKFNKEIIDKALLDLRKKNVARQDVMFLSIGRRMTMLAMQAKLNLYAKYAISNSVKMVNSIAETVIMKIDDATRKERINHVCVWYHKRGKSGPVSVENREIIPFDSEAFKRLKNKPWGTNNIPMVPLDKEKLFSALMNEYLTITIASQLNYSLAAEHFTRMTNMQNAEKNIDENLGELNLEYQQQRQESITDELIDVVSGAEAMRGRK